MACTSPLLAWRLEDGSISFGAKRGQGDAISLPCGQCVGCRLERSRQWAVRCVHESKMHEFNCFITLTYSPEFLPENENLQYSDFQKFMKRLRKEFSAVRIRFYMCGEYGEHTGRPHYHACLFGVDFADKKPLSKTSSGHLIYQSAVLDKLWPFGHASVGALTFESAAYCSRYIMKKVLGPSADEAYRFVNQSTGEIFQRVPEFTKMSLKPGIGRPFYDKFCSDMFPHDRVVVRGSVSKPPRYYAKIYAKDNPLMWEEISYRRTLDVVPSEQSEERLSARDVCNKARVARLGRNSF